MSSAAAYRWTPVRTVALSGRLSRAPTDERACTAAAYSMNVELATHGALRCAKHDSARPNWAQTVVDWVRTTRRAPVSPRAASADCPVASAARHDSARSQASARRVAASRGMRSGQARTNALRAAEAEPTGPIRAACRFVDTL